MLGLLSPATTIALAVGLLSAVILLIVTFAFADANSRRFTRRLQEVTTRKGGAGAVVRSGEPQQRSLARRESATPGIDRLFRLLPRREVCDADGHHVGILAGPQVRDRFGRNLAVLQRERNGRAAVFRSPDGRSLGRVTADADGVRVAFGPAVAGDPFAKMLLLAAALSATAAG